MSTECLCRDLAEKSKNHSKKCFCDLWLFENFSEGEHGFLRSIGKQRTISKGQTVFLQGSPADEIFLIKTGRVKLSKCFEDGSEVILDFRKSGELFGENAFMDDGVFPMDIVAIEETVTCGAKKADLEKIVLKNPNIGLVMMKNMSKKIAALTSRLESMAIGSLEDRLFQILINIAKGHGLRKGKGCQIAFPLTHEELGFLANAHRVSVTRAVNNLLRAGKIVRKGKVYSIPGNDLGEECLKGGCPAR